MLARLREDIAAVFDRDPAARTTWEVLTCYPGLHALVWHRSVVNPLWRRGFRWLSRWLGVAVRLVLVATIYLVCFLAACIGLLIAAVMLR